MEGEVDDITGTIKGLMNARFRKDLGERTKRGQRGAVAQGRAPAGLAYGYRRANRLDERGELIRGLREIDPDQGEVVLRIFAEYASGSSPKAIAGRLNAEGVPAPRGATWRGSTILGDRQRKNGMLNNRLYAGVLVHNRTSKVTDPRSRKTLIRPNPESQWIEQPVPDLAIVDATLWDAVQARRAEGKGVRPEHQRRPKHLLSGLGSCGKCGGGWIRQSHAYWGCGRRKDGGGCNNRLTIHTDRYEAEVLDLLQSNLLHPDLVASYVKEYHLEHARRTGDAGKERASVQRRLGDADRKFKRLVEIVAEGGSDFAEFRDALTKARRDREQLTAQLAELDALPVLALHPGIADQYRREVQALQDALASHKQAKAEAIPKLRALIQAITLTPDPEGKALTIVVSHRMHQVISLATGATAPAQKPKRRAVR
jgi:site-specific DNA recombinase